MSWDWLEKLLLAIALFMKIGSSERSKRESDLMGDNAKLLLEIEKENSRREVEEKNSARSDNDLIGDTLARGATLPERKRTDGSGQG